MALEDRTCWVVQGGPRGRHVTDFVTQGMVSVGWEWPELGDLRETEDAEIFLTLEAVGRRKPADDLRDLRIFTDRMVVGDLAIVLDTAADDLLFGEVAGRYAYSPLGGVHRHVRPVSWFGRVHTDKAEPFLVKGMATRQMLRRLPEQLHWQRLAGEVRDFLGRPADDVPRRATRPAAIRGGGTRTSTPRARAAAKPAPVLTPDKLCPSCGLLRAPSMFPDDDEHCRDCA